MSLIRPAVSTNSVELGLPTPEVFDLIVDARRYPAWLVGAQEIRTVDAGWPAVGTRFEHRIGFGPVRLPGSTRVREVERPHRFVLGAGMGPLGEATVEFDLEPIGSGTLLTVRESPRRGLARLVGILGRPIVAIGLWGRNQTSLASLEAIAREIPAE